MFLQAMRHEKPANVRLGNPSCDPTPCGTTAHEDACEDAFARGLGAGLGLGNFNFLGMKLPCMWSLVNDNCPSNTWAPHTPRAQINGPIFRQNSFPVTWILVPGPKHTLPFVYCVARSVWNRKMSLNSRKKPSSLGLYMVPERRYVSVSDWPIGPVVYALGDNAMSLVQFLV